MDANDRIFGIGHRRHPVTRRPLEQGLGHLSDEKQAILHLMEIEREDGKDIADAMRIEMAAEKNLRVAERNLAKAEGKPF